MFGGVNANFISSCECRRYYCVYSINRDHYRIVCLSNYRGMGWNINGRACVKKKTTKVDLTIKFVVHICHLVRVFLAEEHRNSRTI